MNLRGVKIRTRLALGFGVVIVLMLLMSLLGGWRMLQTERDNLHLAERQAMSVLALQWEGMVRANLNQSLALANMQDPQLRTDFERSVAVSDEKIAGLRKNIKENLQYPEGKVIFSKAAELGDTYHAGRDQAFEDLKAGHYDKARAFFRDEMPVLTAQLLEQTEALSALQTKFVDDTLAESAAGNNRGMLMLALATLLAVLFSPWCSWAITRSITRPLGALIALAARVAKRDLTADVTPTGKDELTQLETLVHEMVINLRSVLGEVQGGADAIALAADQITAGNLDLSARTEQQSAALAQTAASMEEMTSSVKQNADHAHEANELAERASLAANDGREAVSGLTGAMDDINEKSRKMAEIVQVIDDIAFQTNILALNAAVEAARAGEQGRGFAVVASEVRALAQRSAASAREIRDLIDSAITSVAGGNAQAGHTGERMVEIVSGIDMVSSIMSEINGASQEQSAGIGQINAAIAQMDDVTRQNASLVEESTAAVGSLNDQAHAAGAGAGAGAVALPLPASRPLALTTA